MGVTRPRARTAQAEWAKKPVQSRAAAVAKVKRKLLARAETRLGWWQRLALVGLAGLIAGQLLTNVNVQTVAFNSLLYAMLALGLNIAVGWAGLLDLSYIAFFGLGAYGYAVPSSTATHTARAVSTLVTDAHG